MTVPKDEPMDHLATTDEEFDALLDASSLGAPHVVAETGNIPATARRRMAQAVHQQQRSFGMPDSTSLQQPDDEADIHLAVTTDAERARQEAELVQHRCRLTTLYGRNNAGKSAVSAALFVWLQANSETGRSSRREPPARQNWIEPPTTSVRIALWLMQALDEGPARDRPRHCLNSGDPVTLFGRRHTPLRGDLTASAFRSARGAARTDHFVTPARTPAAQLLSPDIGTHAPSTLHALAWAEPWRHMQPLRNLRHLIEPWAQPDDSLVRVTPTGLLVCARPYAPLHIASFSTCAYTTTGGGLLVPKNDGGPQQRHRAEEGDAAGRDRRRSARVDTVKLWRAAVDGAPELSAELPMLFHFDERESPTLTSSLHTRLTYRVSDPYAVEARFHADDADETVWIFARDLLRNGLERRNGLGDVSVWPGTGTQGEPRVFVRLSSPEGSALLSAADADLRAFLDAASNLVSYGAEHPYLLPALNALEATIGELARPGRCD